MASGLLGIEDLTRAEIESILGRARGFQPAQNQPFKKLDVLRGRMPQLKKVVVNVGNNLIYADTYEQALAQLAGSPGPAPVPAPTAPPPAVTTTSAPAPVISDTRIQSIRDHLRRYKELTSQGRLSEAGKELEAIEALAGK